MIKCSCERKLNDCHYCNCTYDENPYSSLVKYDLSKFEELVEQKYLRKCTKDDLVLYTYTEKCTYDGVWNEYTRVARGIILNSKTGEVVAKPFPKFFNLGEKSETYITNLPNEEYIVSEKVDGSLGIIYFYNGMWKVATKGSFDSEQAQKAQTMLKKYDLSYIDQNVTLLCEIIYPENKIVVDYKGEEKLILIGAYHKTGYEYRDVLNHLAELIGMPIRKQYDYTFQEMIDLQKTLPKDQEGFVVRFDNGMRVKIKGEEYLKIHRIISHLSPLSFWEVMKDGKVPLEYIQQVPEEFKVQFEPIVTALENQYNDVRKQIEQEFETLPTNETTPEAKKKVGLHLKQYTYFHEGAMFPRLLNKKEVVDSYIMKFIRPDGNRINL